MNNKTEKVLRKAAYPVGWIYAIVTRIRNKMFDSGVLKSKSYKKAVISVGNITVGGTGKTPFVEYIVGLLKQTYKVAVLSRGYGRRTNGYMEGRSYSNASTIGDEPCQIIRKYPDIVLAVDANRCHALDIMEAKYPDIDAFVLDDAFQHRYVTAGKSILLIDYNRPIMTDRLIPYGNLREHQDGRYRADIVVVNKCPATMTPLEAKSIKKTLNLKAYQKLYYSVIKYDSLRRLSDGAPLELTTDYDVLLVTAIANANPLIEHLSNACHQLSDIRYEDHHKYTSSDINRINKEFNAIPTDKKIVVVTSKDESKLFHLNMPNELADSLYVMDITVDFLFGKKNDFDKEIIDYVRKNKGDSTVSAE